MGWDALKPAGLKQLGDLHGALFTVVDPGDVLALLEGSAVDAQKREATQEWGGVEVGHVRLQNAVVVIGRCWDVFHDGLKQRFEVFAVWKVAVGWLFERCAACLAGCVHDRQFEDRVDVDVRDFFSDVRGQAE